MHTFLKTAIAGILAFFVFSSSASAHDEDITAKLDETLGLLYAILAPAELEQPADEPSELVCEFSFTDGVNIESVNTLLEQIAPCLKSGKETTLILSSLGGETAAAAMFYDMVAYYGDRSLLTVIGVGDIASAAVTMYLAGGTRVISKNASILVHKVTYTFEGTNEMDSDIMRENSRGIESATNILVNVIDEQTLLTREEAEDYVDDHTYFTAHEAVKYGFADKILGDK